MATVSMRRSLCPRSRGGSEGGEAVISAEWRTERWPDNIAMLALLLVLTSAKLSAVLAR